MSRRRKVYLMAKKDGKNAWSPTKLIKKQFYFIGQHFFIFRYKSKSFFFMAETGTRREILERACLKAASNDRCKKFEDCFVVDGGDASVDFGFTRKDFLKKIGYIR